MRRALVANDFEALIAALGMTPAELDVKLSGAIEVLRKVFETSARKVLAENMPKRISANMVFDALNPKAVDYIRTQGARLVTNINETTRNGIRELMRESFELGIPPRQTAERIKKLVGLTPRHAKAVANYKALLLSEGVKPATVDKRVNAYKERLLRWRARNIARTETMKASNNGQLALWDAAIEKGLLDPNKTFKKWIVTPSDRTCERCSSMPSMNTKVPVNGMFQSDSGPIDGPPLHPQCRCVTGLSFTG
jgi:hypothetical protein